MNAALQIGPLSLPWQLLLVLAVFALVQWMGQRLARRAGLTVEPQLLRLLLVSVVAARLGFVFAQWDAYADDWLGVIDIRDGGWMPMLGLLAAAVYVGTRRSALRKPLWAAYFSGAALYAIGTVALGLLVPVAKPLPALTLSSLEGPSVALRQFVGQPTVLNVWASWCPPCRREMPQFAIAQQRHSGVHFVFVNQGESAPSVQAFLEKNGLPLRNVLLDVRGEVAQHFGYRALPTTLFFDAQGVLKDVRIGELSPATLNARLKQLGVPLSSAPGQEVGALNSPSALAERVVAER